MAEPDFYKILEVSRTASADEIKSAHRELVKKYHPDLFPSGTQKARANKKLQQINEAYAVLSNVERRRRYDSRLFQKAQAANQAAEASKRRSTATPRRPPPAKTWENLARRSNKNLQETFRSLSKAARNYYSDLSQKLRTAKQAANQSTATFGHSRPSAATAWNFARRWSRWVSVKMAAGILGIMILVLVLRAVWEEPEITIEWTLLQSTVVEPSRDKPGLKPGDRSWSPLGYYRSKAQCAANIKQQVTMDEQRGSKVFLDEGSGAIAMTIYGKTEAVLTEEFLHEKLKQGNSSGVDLQALERQARDEAQEFLKKNGFVQRVKHYQCHETQVARPESWLRNKLRRFGLIS